MAVKTLSDSLRGKNTCARAGSVRSSRARSSLFTRLRKLDSKISLLDYQIECYPFCGWVRLKDLQAARDKADLKRKEVRLKRKGYL